MTLDVRNDLTEPELESTVSIADLRRQGICVQGQRRWYTANGFDFRKVMKEGARIRDIMQFADGESDLAISRVIEKRRAEADG